MGSPSVFNQPTSQWVHAAAITDPSGGATVDTQARAAVVSILAVLRKAGVIAGATSLPTHTRVWNANRNAWALSANITAPTGGTTTDANARTAINSVLSALQKANLIDGNPAGPNSPVFDASPSQWADAAAIADVSGGATVDDVCRTALNAALAAMRDAEIIA